jgi:hypothetical protein
LGELKLYLPGTADLTPLTKLMQLQRLHLHVPHLNDNSLKALELLENLVYLDIFGTVVTPRSAKSLAKLTRLKTLKINTTATEAKGKTAANAWRTALSHVQIRLLEAPVGVGFGGGLSGAGGR